MKKFFLAVAFCFLSSVSFAQIQPISNLSLEDEKAGGYFVMITADWCEQCQVMKNQLTFLGNSNLPKIYTLDADSTKGKALLAGRSLPQLIRYEFFDGRVRGALYQYRETLRNFVFKKLSRRIQVFPPESPVPKPIEELKKIEEPKKVTEIVVITPSLVAPAPKEGITRDMLRSLFRPLLSAVDSLESKIFSNMVDNFAKLRQALSEQAEVLRFLKEDRVTLLEKLSELSKDRGHILANLAEARAEATTRNALQIKLNNKLLDALIELRKNSAAERLKWQEQRKEAIESRTTILDRLGNLFRLIFWTICVVGGVVVVLAITYVIHLFRGGQKIPIIV